MAGEDGAVQGATHAGGLLKKNLAGLPVWAWAGIVIVGVGVAYFFMKQQKGTATPSTGSTPGDNVVSQTGNPDQEGADTGGNGANPNAGAIPPVLNGGSPEPPVPPSAPGPPSAGGPPPLPVGTHIIRDKGFYWYETPGSEDRRLLSALTQQAAQQAGQTPYLPIGSNVFQEGHRWYYILPGTTLQENLIMPPGAARTSKRGSVLR